MLIVTYAGLCLVSVAVNTSIRHFATNDIGFVCNFTNQLEKKCTEKWSVFISGFIWGQNFGQFSSRFWPFQGGKWRKIRHVDLKVPSIAFIGMPTIGPCWKYSTLGPILIDFIVNSLWAADVIMWGPVFRYSQAKLNEEFAVLTFSSIDAMPLNWRGPALGESIHSMPILIWNE